MSCNLGLYECISSFFSKSKEAKYLEVGQFKKNDDLDTRSQQTALELLQAACSKSQVTDPQCVKTISQKYIEVFRLERDSIEEADKCINTVVHKYKGFLKQFSTATASEILMQPMKPSERVALNTHICTSIR